ncbi:hypothetical protein EDB85DRAFT_1884808 [Lactarius pseudohatsudake]|nr:hypothetical protein EDB85DRAFT_1884808 [Lactarius pseudohatsudake]
MAGTGGGMVVEAKLGLGSYAATSVWSGSRVAKVGSPHSLWLVLSVLVEKMASTTAPKKVPVVARWLHLCEEAWCAGIPWCCTNVGKAVLTHEYPYQPHSSVTNLLALLTFLWTSLDTVGAWTLVHIWCSWGNIQKSKWDLLNWTMSQCLPVALPLFHPLFQQLPQSIYIHTMSSTLDVNSQNHPPTANPHVYFTRFLLPDLTLNHANGHSYCLAKTKWNASQQLEDLKIGWVDMRTGSRSQAHGAREQVPVTVWGQVRVWACLSPEPDLNRTGPQEVRGSA